MIYKSILNIGSNSIIKRIVSGTSWVFIGTVISKSVVFLATICIARILSKEAYGELSIIRSTIQLFVSLSGFGIGATATKFIAEYRKNDPKKTINIYLVANIFVWVIAVISCLVLTLFSSYIAIERLNQEELILQFRIASIILFFTLLNGAQIGTLSGFEDFKRIAKCNVIMGLFEIVFLCIGAYLWGLTGAVVGFGLTYCVGWVYNSIGIRRHLQAFHLSLITELKKIEFGDFRILFSFSLPLAAVSWIHMFTYWWMKTSVAGTSGFENMANYDVAEQWKNLILMIPNMIASVILPILSNINANLKDRRNVVRLNLYINVGITGTLSVLIFILGKWILLLFGSVYTNVWPLYILAISTVLDSISSICGTLLISSNKVFLGLISNMIWAVSLAIAYTIFKNNVENLENGLAMSYVIASVMQMFVNVSIIKLKHLY